MPEIEIKKEEKPTVKQILEALLSEIKEFNEPKTHSYIKGFLDGKLR